MSHRERSWVMVFRGRRAADPHESQKDQAIKLGSKSIRRPAGTAVAVEHDAVARRRSIVPGERICLVIDRDPETLLERFARQTVSWKCHRTTIQPWIGGRDGCWQSSR